MKIRQLTQTEQETQRLRDLIDEAKLKIQLAETFAEKVENGSIPMALSSCPCNLCR